MKPIIDPIFKLIYLIWLFFLGILDSIVFGIIWLFTTIIYLIYVFKFKRVFSYYEWVEAFLSESSNRYLPDEIPIFPFKKFIIHLIDWRWFILGKPLGWIKKR